MRNALDQFPIRTLRKMRVGVEQLVPDASGGVTQTLPQRGKIGTGVSLTVDRADCLAMIDAAIAHLAKRMQENAQ